ncbi:MAG: HNH endonuclease [Bacteroidetes bacterium]|nr:HNH endonuclease [Bacteroidota bacterium]
MIKSAKNEEWKELKMPKGALRYRYAISNKGRIASFTDKINDGKVLSGTSIGGYPTLNVKPFGENKTFYIHKIVAELFIKKSSPKQKFVIHKDHKKENNAVKNLKWSTKEEMESHQQSSPLVLKAREDRMNRPVYKGHKLTVGLVKQIKRKIFAKSRKQSMKEIAEHYDISEMQLYRIKSGENWSHVEI